jgi:hypothetical protein
MLTNTILRQLFLCPTAASAPKRIADAPCSDVTPPLGYMRYYGIGGAGKSPLKTTHPDGNPPGCTIINML